MSSVASGKKVVEDNNNSQECSDCDMSDNEIPYDMYYGDDDFCDTALTNSQAGTSGERATDPEKFEYECLSIADVERLLKSSVDALCAAIPVSPALASALLHQNGWDVEAVARSYRADSHALLLCSHLKSPDPVPTTPKTSFCPVCARTLPSSDLKGLACAHDYCRSCWLLHCESQLRIGVSTGLECMESGCRLLAPDDFLRALLAPRPELGAKYRRFVFQDHVKSHASLRFCPGPDCGTVIRALGPPEAKAVRCSTCTASFCFHCGLDAHAPTSCDWIRRWLMKCADDSETANYITANTKDCPNCHSCIEKNGGCNHMQCTKCKHHFCWMCLQDWKHHGSEYYECSRYKENPGIVNETVHVKARAALEKYLFYFERWENHAKSLRMEEALNAKIMARVAERVGEGEGTWIDWQFLDEAARLLTRSRYTLQYTYPYAYFSPPGPRKELFEYQQAQLEKEIEELSWKVERAETSDHGAMERQMHVIEQKRRTLLEDFVPS